MKFSIVFFLLIITAYLWANAIVSPPVPESKIYYHTIYGQQVLDEFFWLQEKTNPEVLDYILKENQYAEDMMAGTQQMQEKLLEEFYSFREKSSISKDIEVQDYFYYIKRDSLGIKNVYRKHKNSENEELVLNLQKQSQAHSFAKLMDWKISPDNKYISFLMDFSGQEIGTLFLKEIKQSSAIQDSLYGVSNMFFWLGNETLYYVSREYPFKFKKLYKHTAKTSFSEDILVTEVTADDSSIDIFEAKDFLHFIKRENSNFEVFYIEKETEKIAKLMPDRKSHFSYLFNHDYIFLFENETLYITEFMNPQLFRKLKEYDNHSTLITGELCKDYVILFEEKQGAQMINVFDFKSKTDYYIQLPDASYNIWNIDSKSTDKDYFDFSYTSLVKPETHYRYHLKTKQLEIIAQKTFKNYDESLYQTEKIFIDSHDNKKIPVSLVYKKNLFKQDGSNPLFLRAYGAYGYSQYPGFEAHLFSLLNRGFVYAVAHVRGGSEMGKQWHLDSIGQLKSNSVKDYISVTEALITQKYSSEKLITAFGRSAGGRLTASAVNTRPDLYSTAIFEVPATDISSWLTERRDDTHNLREFGDPLDKDDFEFFKIWDPYLSIKAQNYPSILITAGWNDIRVKYSQPVKFGAKLRKTKTDNSLLLIKTDIDAGHRGGSTGNSYLTDWAYKYAFIFKELNITE